MIQEEFVTLETAKLLREAGFPQDDGDWVHLYDADGNFIYFPAMYARNPVVAPTQAQAMRWLREEKDISVEPHITLEETWVGDVWEYVEVFNLYEDDEARFPTYEAAAEAGIQAACKYLVKKKE